MDKKASVSEKQISEIVRRAFRKVFNHTGSSDNFCFSSLSNERKFRLAFDLSFIARVSIFDGPVGFDGEKLIISENEQKISEPIERVREVLKNRYCIQDWQITEEEIANKVKLIIICGAVFMNEKIITAQMEYMGWFKSYSRKATTDDGFPIIYMDFEPMYQDTIRGTVREWKYLYHLSPECNAESILTNGLIPSSKNGTFNYPPRVYLLKPSIGILEMGDFIEQLKNASPQHKNEKYCLFKIELDKVPNEVEFYYDARYEWGIYTNDKIPPSAITIENFKNG